MAERTLVQKVLDFVKWLADEDDQDDTPISHPRGFDLTLGHSQVRALCELAVAGDFAGFEAAYLELGPDGRYVAMTAVQQQPVPAEALDEWVRTSPSFVAPLLKGALLVHHAWEARGYGYSNSVSAEQKDKYLWTLNASWQYLTAAHHVAKNEAEPLAWMIRVGMGLSKSIEELLDIFSACVNTGAGHLGATMHIIEALAPKWSGSDDAALTIARQHAANVPHQHSGIARAHIELWTTDDSDEYFDNKDVRAEIIWCCEQDSNISERDDYFRFFALNVYAFCFYMMDDHERAKQALHLMSDKCTVKPWAYVGKEPGWILTEARTDVGLPAL